MNQVVARPARDGYRRALDGLANHPVLDLLVVAAILGLHIIAVYKWQLPNFLGEAQSSQRIAVYAAGAGVTSLVAGFAGTAIAVYGSSSGDLVNELRIRFGQVVHRNWRSIISWLLLSAMVCIAAMSIDSDSSPRASEWVFETAILISMAKFARLIFLFGLVMTFVDEDSRASKSAAVPRRRGRRSKSTM